MSDDKLATVSPPATDIELIQRMIEQKADPAQLEKFMDLLERANRRRAEEQFNQAMNVCQAEMPAVIRQSKNAQTGSTYASLDDINPIVKPVYTRYGFSLSFSEAECPLPEHKRTICDIRHRGGHSVQRFIDLPLDGVGAKGNPIGNMNRVQAGVSTGTYGQRVLLCRIFNLSIADNDNDGAGLLDTLIRAEVDELEAMLTESGADRARFFAWVTSIQNKVEVADLAGILRKNFGIVKDRLNSKIAEKRKVAGAA